MNEKRFIDDGYEAIDEQSFTDTWTDKTYYVDYFDEIIELVNNLSEENEQLKQRNNRQAKQLDRLYRLIEEKDWRTLSDILDDFKRCEELLQRESGTYSDLND